MWSQLNNFAQQAVAAASELAEEVGADATAAAQKLVGAPAAGRPAAAPSRAHRLDSFETLTLTRQRHFRLSLQNQARQHVGTLLEVRPPEVNLPSLPPALQFLPARRQHPQNPIAAGCPTVGR